MLNHYPDGAAVNELQRAVFGILLGPEESEAEPAQPDLQPAAPEPPASAAAPPENPAPAATPVPQ
jgi:hypothetical protein